jgi:hypothetical protein
VAMSNKHFPESDSAISNVKWCIDLQ